MDLGSNRRTLPPLVALRAFEAAARHVSFAKAAEELNVSASAISQLVRSLEQRTGAILFERGARSIALTERGRAYARAAAAALDALETATIELMRAEPQDRLTLAAPPEFAQGWLVPGLQEFAAAEPGIDLAVVATTRWAEPGRDGIDALVRHGRGGWPEPVCTYLFAEALAPYASPALLASGPPVRGVPDLAHHVLLQSIQDPGEWEEWLRQAGMPGLAPRALRRYGDRSLTLQGAVLGAGIALLDHRLAAAALDERRLVSLLPEHEYVPGSAYFLITATDRPARPLAALAAWMQARADIGARLP